VHPQVSRDLRDRTPGFEHEPNSGSTNSCGYFLPLGIAGASPFSRTECPASKVSVKPGLAQRDRLDGDEVMPTEAATLFHVRDGKVARLVIYWDRDRALAELGLTPKTD
jgi:hypothetical protein